MKRLVKTFFVLLPLSCLLVAFQTTQAQSTFHVDGIEGNDSFDGSRMGAGLFPAGAIHSIQYAVNKADSGDRIVIRAGDYTDQGVINPGDKDLTFVVLPRGNDSTVILDGLKVDAPDRILTLTNSLQAKNGSFVTNGDENDLTLAAGTLHVDGALSIGKGGVIEATRGKLTGNIPADF